MEQIDEILRAPKKRQLSSIHKQILREENNNERKNRVHESESESESDSESESTSPESRVPSPESKDRRPIFEQPRISETQKFHHNNNMATQFRMTAQLKANLLSCSKRCHFLEDQLIIKGRDRGTKGRRAGRTKGEINTRVEG